ncbi:TatD family hydrolase [bacterium AH-315-J21]|nr:TatD family hydrolase [bacterium AH-315-J21]
MIDSHCHLESRQYAGILEDVITRAREANISTMVNIGTDLPTSHASLALAEKYPEIYATAGVHPHSATEFDNKTKTEIRDLLQNPKVVALGEIGLDYYRDLSPRDIQKRVFREQLEIAAENDTPVVIHVRESFTDAFEIMSDFSSQLSSVVFHCFSEDIAAARKIFDLGWIISVGGVVTYKKATMADVAKFAPLESMMLETDSPYLTPTPHRGKLNEPAHVRFVCQKVAELKELTSQEVERQTDLTTNKFYRLVETFG